MRHALWALLILVPMVAAAAPREHTPLPPPCMPPPIEVRVEERYVALRWEPACDAASYTVLRGTSLHDLAPIVEVAHAGHIDVGAPRGEAVVYALRIGDGPVGPAIVAPVPAA